jgi:hypothetical protein
MGAEVKLALHLQDRPVREGLEREEAHLPAWYWRVFLSGFLPKGRESGGNEPYGKVST